MAENTNTTKKLTPPSDGLDWLLQRTTTSFLFLIPKVCENESNSKLLINAIKIPPNKNPRAYVKSAAVKTNN